MQVEQSQAQPGDGFGIAVGCYVVHDMKRITNATIEEAVYVASFHVGQGTIQCPQEHCAARIHKDIHRQVEAGQG